MARKYVRPLSPFIEITQPGNPWRWGVSYSVKSNGYPGVANVTATRQVDDDVIAATCWSEVPPFADLEEVLEFLAVEAMLAACIPSLPGTGVDQYHREFRC